VPVHFTAFHPDYRMLDKSRTPHATLCTARRIALENGVRYPYVGNVHDRGRASTYCHQCGAILIERDWHQLLRWALDAEGRCRSCGTHCAGVFDATPGNWGQKRLPVRLADFDAVRAASK